MFALFALAHAEDLYVTSNERGAAILLDGVDTGYTTPATIRGVKPGRAEVTVEGGCSRGEALVDVLPTVTTRVSIVATEQLGTLSLVPTPPNARLELDGATFPGSPGVPLAVSCGEHTVRAGLDGYVTAVVTVEVGMGQDLTVPLTLQKLGIGTLELSVAPRNATLYLDGKPVGSDAVTLPSVYQGVHTVSAELDGYQTAKKQVVVEAGGTGAYHFDLARTSAKRQSTVTRLGGEPEPATSGSGAGAVPAVVREDDGDAEREATARAEAKRAAERESAAKAREAEEREAKAREAKARDATAAEDAAREAEEREAREVEAREAKARAAEAAEDEAREEAERTAAARAEREAEKRAAEEAEAEKRAAAKKARSETSTAGVERDGPPVGKTIGGVALLAGGVGAGVFSAMAYDGASRAYSSYAAKLEDAGADKQRQRLADDYYDDNVVPRQNLFYGTAAGSALFLASGVVVLVVDEHTPTFVPAPGGGMLLWSGRF